MNKVNIAGINTSSLVVLKNDEMIELFKKVQKGDKEARNMLAKGNLRLVLSILKKFNEKDNIDDLFQIGCIGLMKSIDNFDLSQNVKFSTYAVPMIQGEIKRYLRDNNELRISRSIKDLAYQILKYENNLEYEDLKKISPDKLAKKFNVSKYDIDLAINSLKEPISIFKPVYNDGGDTIYLYDQIEDKSKSKKDINLEITLYESIKKLKKREKYILKERYIVGKTQMEVGESLKISQAQVSRIEKNAIKKLKKTIKR